MAAPPQSGKSTVDYINDVVKIGEIVTQPITDKWFYWAMLTFILHHKDWKYANFNIAILMWVIHSIALMYPKIQAFRESNVPEAEKLTGTDKWKFIDVPPFIFYYISEIIGDWYVVFILKQIVSRKKYGIAGVLCILSNCIKLIICVFLFTGDDQCSLKGNKPENFNCFRDSELWKTYQKLECLNILCIALYYGACLFILYTTKDDYESQSKLNPSSFTLIKRFRRDSKYRMMFSCLCALVSCCFGIPFIVDTFTRNFTFRLEVTREAIMSLTYYMVYIDQILKSEQSGGQAFRSTTNDQSTNNYSGNHSGKMGFSSKGVLDSSKIHDNEYGATPRDRKSVV